MRPLPTILAVVGLLAYVVSFTLPAVELLNDALPGWSAAYTSAGMTLDVIQSLIWRTDLPPSPYSLYCAGTIANLLTLSGVAFGGKLRRQPAILCALFGGALAAALLVPLVGEFERAVSTGGPWPSLQVLRDGYAEFRYGYWCWCGSMAVLTLAVLASWRSWRTASRNRRDQSGITRSPRSTETCSSE